MRPRAILHLAKADFLERVRRRAFFFAVLASLWIGYLTASGKVVLGLGTARGVLDSAWIGGQMAAVAGAFLTLVGFYVVNDGVARDERTRVGSVLAATTMSRAEYALGKLASNAAVLVAMALVLAAAAVAMVPLRAEVPGFDLGGVLAPMLLLVAPSLVFVGALAFLFETVPVLRSGAGNVIYGIVVWPALLVAGFLPTGVDVFGLRLLRASMSAAAGLGPNASFALSSSRAFEQVFTWPGVAWTGAALASRVAVLAVGVALGLVGALFFHRFNPARRGLRSAPVAARAASNEGAGPLDAAAGPAVDAAPRRALAPPPAFDGGFVFGRVFTAELRLALRGHSKLLYAALGALVLGQALAPLGTAHGLVLPLAWLLPVIVWSPMGTREARGGPGVLVLCAPRALGRQLPAVWLAGVAVAIAVGAPTAVRLAAHGELRALAAWAVGALFVPGLALALGVFTGSAKAFEVGYALLWYLGPLNGTSQLDFVGATGGRAATPAFAIATVALLAAAHLRRRAELYPRMVGAWRRSRVPR